MSRDDYETSQTLITPHIEIGTGSESDPHSRAYVNVETFRKCLGKMTSPSNQHGPAIPNYPFYSIYGVVARSVASLAGDSYVNIGEPPISRTLMGYLEEKILAEKLPRTFEILKAREEADKSDRDALEALEESPEVLEEPPIEDREESPFEQGD